MSKCYRVFNATLEQTTLPTKVKKGKGEGCTTVQLLSWVWLTLSHRNIEFLSRLWRFKRLLDYCHYKHYNVNRVNILKAKLPVVVAPLGRSSPNRGE